VVDHFRYPFPNDPGAQVETAVVLMTVRLADGREVTYTGHATRADYEHLGGGPTLDTSSPTGVAQAYKTTIDWVSGTVRRTDNLAEWREQRELETARKEIAGPEYDADGVHRDDVHPEITRALLHMQKSELLAGPPELDPQDDDPEPDDYDGYIDWLRRGNHG
jgi:hypothetical protein